MSVYAVKVMTQKSPYLCYNLSQFYLFDWQGHIIEPALAYFFMRRTFHASISLDMLLCVTITFHSHTLPSHFRCVNHVFIGSFTMPSPVHWPCVHCHVDHAYAITFNVHTPSRLRCIYHVGYCAFTIFIYLALLLPFWLDWIIYLILLSQDGIT
jgi:hypothetical protein